MSNKIKRTQKEVDSVLNRANEYTNGGKTKFWGLKYEEGLREMYYWLTEDDPECDPMSD